MLLVSEPFVLDQLDRERDRGAVLQLLGTVGLCVCDVDSVHEVLDECVGRRGARCDFDAVRDALPMSVAVLGCGEAVAVPLPSFHVVIERDNVNVRDALAECVLVALRLLGAVSVTLLAGLCVCDFDAVRDAVPLALPRCREFESVSDSLPLNDTLPEIECNLDCVSVWATLHCGVVSDVEAVWNGECEAVVLF